MVDANSRIFVISGLSRPPSAVKNLIPFLLKGKWLAVSIAAPSNLEDSNMVDIYIAGVDANPQSTAVAPVVITPSKKSFH